MKSKKRIMIYGMIRICTIILGTTAVYSLAISEETAKNTKPDELDENLELTDDPIILEFCDECCNEVYINPWNQSQLGIREITWIDDTTVFVRAHASINCAFWIEGGGFHIHYSYIFCWKKFTWIWYFNGKMYVWCRS